jgi:hypothetical protein
VVGLCDFNFSGVFKFLLISFLFIIGKRLFTKGTNENKHDLNMAECPE